MLRSGLYRHAVTVERATEVRDGHGQPIRTWATFASWRCAIVPLRGREFFAARQLSAETTHKLSGHYISGVSPKDRIKFGSRTFRIEQVINVEEKGRELELMCVEVLS